MTSLPDPSGAYPPPPLSVKGRYPFRLGTTSFIYPDDYLPNVQVLGPHLDEIELLLFESRRADSLPSGATIDALARLSAEMDVGYNIHLPTDVSLAAEDPDERARAAAVLGRFVSATAPLSPSAYALHLPFEGGAADPDGIGHWQAAAAQGIARLLETGAPRNLLAVETLDYPFAWAAPLVEAFDLSVCMDIGHLILHGVDPVAFFKRFRRRIRLIHLHGVRFTKDGAGRDHVGLEEMPPEHFGAVMAILKDFDGVVSLEVFSYRHLAPSMKHLDAAWAAAGRKYTP